MLLFQDATAWPHLKFMMGGSNKSILQSDLALSDFFLYACPNKSLCRVKFHIGEKVNKNMQKWLNCKTQNSLLAEQWEIVYSQGLY